MWPGIAASARRMHSGPAPRAPRSGLLPTLLDFTSLSADGINVMKSERQLTRISCWTTSDVRRAL